MAVHACLPIFAQIPATARRRIQVLLSRAGVFLFRFLYFCPREDDLDLDEEVGEERRR